MEACLKSGWNFATVVYVVQSSGSLIFAPFIRTVFIWPISIRESGVKAIENLIKQKGRFDYVLLETTGLADPGKPHSH